MRAGFSQNFAVAAILVVFLLLTYGPVIFGGSTLSNITTTGAHIADYYSGRRMFEYATIDPGADSWIVFPLERLAIAEMLSGHFPLWDPYTGCGKPLAADPLFGAYAPTSLLHVMGPYFEDLRFILRLCIAALGMFLFLRELGIRQTSAVAGAIVYSLSGPLTLSVQLDWIETTMLTPYLLLFCERLLRRPGLRPVIPLGCMLTLSLLGAHLETIVLQYMFLVMYLLLRGLQTRSGRKDAIGIPLAKFLLATLVATGLSAFFVIPLLENILLSPITFHTGAGLAFLPSATTISLFVPYFFGGVHSSWSQTVPAGVWNWMACYVGVGPLFLTIIAIIPERRRQINVLAAIFVFLAVLAQLKTIGAPVLNWIGGFPILESIVFPRFLGFWVACCFAVTAAIGIDSMSNGFVGRRRVVISLALTLSILGFLAGIAASSDAINLARLYPTDLSSAWTYVMFIIHGLGGIVKAILFVSALAILAVYCEDKRILLGVLAIEFASYVPFGISPSFYVAREILACGLVIAYTLWNLHRLPTFLARPIRLGSVTLPRTKHLISVSILLCLVLGQTMLVWTSPLGLPNRYDAIEDFRTRGLVHFLKDHQDGYSRIYSFDRALMPNYAGLFGLYHLGAFSLTTQTFQDFARCCLDSGASFPTLTSNEWERNLAEPDPLTQLHKNLRFYSFLGVKYFVTSGTDLNRPSVGLGHDDAIVEPPEVASNQTFPVVYKDEHSTVFENPQAFPRAFFVHEYQVVLDYREALTAIQSPDFNLRKHVVLDASPALDSVPAETEPDSARITSYETGRVSILAETRAPGILILTDVYYPEWKVYVDGKPAYLLRADGIARAVVVPAGVHEVVFSYEPLSFTIGSMLSLLTVIMGASSYVLRYREQAQGRDRRDKPEPSHQLPSRRLLLLCHVLEKPET